MVLLLLFSDQGSLSFEKQCFYQDVLFADPVSSSKLKSDRDGKFLRCPTLHMLCGDLSFSIGFAAILSALSMLCPGASSISSAAAALGCLPGTAISHFEALLCCGNKLQRPAEGGAQCITWHRCQHPWMAEAHTFIPFPGQDTLEATALVAVPLYGQLGQLWVHRALAGAVAGAAGGLGAGIGQGRQSQG